jgi:hypothetical protein
MPRSLRGEIREFLTALKQSLRHQIFPASGFDKLVDPGKGTPSSKIEKCRICGDTA